MGAYFTFMASVEFFSQPRKCFVGRFSKGGREIFRLLLVGLKHNNSKNMTVCLQTVRFIKFDVELKNLKTRFWILLFHLNPTHLATYPAAER